MSIEAGPESLEDYFQKDAHLGQQAALNLWYVDTRPNSQKRLSYFAFKIQKQLIFSYIFCSHNSNRPFQ